MSLIFVNYKINNCSLKFSSIWYKLSLKVEKGKKSKLDIPYSFLLFFSVSYFITPIQLIVWMKSTIVEVYNILGFYQVTNIWIFLSLFFTMSSYLRKIPWMEEPDRLQSMGSQRVGHYWMTSLSLFTCMHWRRKRQPTPVLLPGESQGRGSPVGCRLWVRTKSDTTEAA